MFESFGKIPRLSKGWSVSEKLDGTNAQIYIVRYEEIEFNPDVTDEERGCITMVGDLALVAGSRNRLISREKDNFGFAAWVQQNAEDLARLGPGRHFGEWVGPGIQKNPLDLPEKALYLFNPRWIDQGPECVLVVPQLGTMQTEDLEGTFHHLGEEGTFVGEAGPEAKRPEGIIALHLGSNQLYKRTFENDEGKWV